MMFGSSKATSLPLKSACLIATAMPDSQCLLPGCLVFLSRLQTSHLSSYAPTASGDSQLRGFATAFVSRPKKRSLRDEALLWTRQPRAKPAFNGTHEGNVDIGEVQKSDAAVHRNSFINLKDAEPPREKKPARFVDRLRVTVQAGKGGNGCNSFWRSQAKGKFRPADGGNGGRGGDVVLQASPRIKSLAGLNHLHKAAAGANGGKQKLSGSRGKDCVIQVPLGTVVYLPEEQNGVAGQSEQVPDWVLRPNEPWIGARDYTSDDDENSDLDNNLPGRTDASSELTHKQHLGRQAADLREAGQQFLLARGGEGGRGNAFLSSRLRKTAESTSISGSAGERVDANLEVRVLADIGLVGAPNAGKSSLLRALSAASPKVASYPFTTLQPHLGSVHCTADLSLTVADIPGLIPGAAFNRGLGHAFLRHISRARALVYVLDIASGSGDNRDTPKPWDQLMALQEEVRLYSEELLKKPAIIVANKMDKLTRPATTIAALRRRTSLSVVAVSAIHGEGIGDLKRDLTGIVKVDNL